MKVLRTAALVVGTVAAVALIATGFGAPIGAGVLGVTWGTMAATAAVVTTATTLASKPPGPSAVGSATQFQADPHAGVPYWIGRTAFAGRIVHREGFGAELNEVENPYQAFVIVWSGGGPMHSFEAFQVDRSTVTFDGTGAVTTSAYRREAYVPGGGKVPNSPFMWLETQLGTCPEAAALASPVPYSIPNWGASHKLSGLAAGIWALRFDKNAKLFMSGVPAPLMIGQGVLVYDPRLDSTYPGGSGSCRPLQEETYVYSENPALHALTFALGRWQNGSKVMGVGLPWSGIDVGAFVEAANVDDANGWKAGGIVSSLDNKWDVLKKLGQAGGFTPIRLGAQLSCIVNAPRVSLATITSEDLVGRGTVVATQSQRERINGIIPRIRSEDHGWEVVPLDVVRPSTYLTEDGEERTRERDYHLVQQKDQASELAAYDVCNGREFGPITLPLKIRYTGYKPGDCLTIDIPEMGLIEQKALMTYRSIDPTAGVPTLQLMSETDEKHDFALGRTGVAPPTPGLTPPDIGVVPAPHPDDWEVTGGVVDSPGGQLPAIIVIGQASYATLDAVIFEYRKTGDTDWTLAATESPTIERKEITGLPPSQEYDVAVSYKARNIVGERLILGPVTTGEWSIIGDLDARIEPNSVQLPASYFGVVSDYSAAEGTWILRAGTVDVSSYFTIGTAPDGNPFALDVTYGGMEFAVTGGFDSTLIDTAYLVMRAQGSGPFAAVTADRKFSLSKIRVPYAVDVTPPDGLTDLDLSSELRTDSDGTQRVYLIATWPASDADDLAYYRLKLREEGGNWIEYLTSETHYSVQVLGGVTYEAVIQVVDVAGNVSISWPTGGDVESHVAASDGTVPAAPANLVATPVVRIIHYTWTNVGDADLHHVEVWTNSVNNTATANKVGTVLAEAGQPGYTSISGLATGTTLYCWLKSVDTSGHASGFTAVASATTAAVGNDDIFAGSLYANRLMVSGNSTLDALPTGIRVGAGGTTIGTIDTRANDPIARANTRSTVILPGLVLISGSLTLADIRWGPDQTKIDGDHLGTGTVTSNKIVVGNRGIAIDGIEFEHNKPSINSVSWTAGTFNYIGDAGTATTHNVNAGQATWTSGKLYIYMDLAAGGASLFTTTTQATAVGPTKIVLAIYAGGTNLVVTHGRAIIDGAHVKAETFTGDVFVANTITSRELATTTLITAEAQIGTAVVSTLHLKGGGVVTVPHVTEGSDVTIPGTGTTTNGSIITVATSPAVTVGDATYGVALVEVSGTMDSGLVNDCGIRMYLDTNNGSGWVTQAQAECGSRTDSGANTYAKIPIFKQFAVEGVQTVQVRIRAQSIVMPGASASKTSTFRDPTITIMGGKR